MVDGQLSVLKNKRPRIYTDHTEEEGQNLLFALSSLRSRHASPFDFAQGRLLRLRSGFRLRAQPPVKRLNFGREEWVRGSDYPRLKPWAFFFRPLQPGCIVEWVGIPGESRGRHQPYVCRRQANAGRPRISRMNADGSLGFVDQDLPLKL